MHFVEFVNYDDAEDAIKTLIKGSLMVVESELERSKEELDENSSQYLGNSKINYGSRY